MKNIIKITIVLVVAFLWCNFANAQINAGFVQGLWYSKPIFFAGDKVRIYSAIQNQSEYDITGTVEFMVDEKKIGSSNFSAIKGRLVENWVDWDVTKGGHDIYVQITNAKKYVIGQNPEDITLIFFKSQIDKKVIDVDTDKDGVGNTEDKDDDDDGLTDEEETNLKTDPTKTDTDGDGVSDKIEKDRGTDPTKADGIFAQEKFSLKSSIANSSTGTMNEVASFKKENKEILKNTIINIPSNFVKSTDYIANRLQDIKDESSKNYIQSSTGTMAENPSNIQKTYWGLLSFLIFIFEHKILLIMVLLAVLFISWKIFRLFLRLIR